MTISNWFVRCERVKEKGKGLIEYCEYLVDRGHINHYLKTQKIIGLLGNYREFAKDTVFECVAYDSKNKKGGRPIQSYAQSFVFSLPDSLPSPTPEEWKMITKELIISIAKKMKLSPRRLAKASFANIHQQSNPHLNLLIPRVIDGVMYDMLDKFSMLGTVKSTFNRSVFQYCGHDYKSYKPKPAEHTVLTSEAVLTKKVFVDEVDFIVPPSLGNGFLHKNQPAPSVLKKPKCRS